MGIKRLGYKPHLIISKNDELFAQARNESPLIMQVLDGGGSLQDCIVALHGFIKDLIRENMRLDAIAPFKVQCPDGTVKIYNPPEDAIPFKIYTPKPEIKIMPDEKEVQPS